VLRPVAYACGAAAGAFAAVAAEALWGGEQLIGPRCDGMRASFLCDFV
jgi:hypothetical protein